MTAALLLVFTRIWYDLLSPHLKFYPTFFNNLLEKYLHLKILISKYHIVFVPIRNIFILFSNWLSLTYRNATVFYRQILAFFEPLECSSGFNILLAKECTSSSSVFNTVGLTMANTHHDICLLHIYDMIYAIKTYLTHIRLFLSILTRGQVAYWELRW